MLILIDKIALVEVLVIAGRSSFVRQSFDINGKTAVRFDLC